MVVEENNSLFTGKTLMSWQAPEYIFRKKSNDWYWALGLVSLILFGLAVYQRSFPAAILILISWFTIMMYAVRQPRMVNFAITENGVQIDQRIYPWSNLKSFWIFYNANYRQELVISPKIDLVGGIKINIQNQDPMKIKEVVVKFLPEAEIKDSIIDHLIYWIGF